MPCVRQNRDPGGGYPTLTPVTQVQHVCVIQVPNLATAFFRRGEERKQRRLVEEEAWSGTEKVITPYWIPLAPVTSFKYLGRVLSASDENCPAVVQNLWQAQQKWVWLSRVLIREGVDDRTSGRIYVAVVQVVLIYRLDTWVTTPRIGMVLGGFHHRVAHRMTG